MPRTSTVSRLAWLVPMASLVLVACDKKDQDCPRPTTTYDVLAQDTGYWEWQSSGTFRQNITPATVGFTRQLVFEGKGQLTIRHDGQLHSQVAYQLTNAPLPHCNPQPTPVPLVTFTAEPQIPNNDRKVYSIETTSTGRVLRLIGEGACTDAGYYETYVWHAQ